MLTKRDRAIIRDLNKFRVMDRDSIAELHFEGLKNPKGAANNVLLRLLRDGHIQRATAFVPYVYFGAESTVKKNSAKIGHWLAILEVYKDARRAGRLESFLVEPKYGGKGTVEPDATMRYRKTEFFVEVQKTLYSDKQMKQKLDRYVDLYEAKVLQPFPHVLILSAHRYAIDGSYPFKVFQAESFTQFLQALKGNAGKKPNHTGGIKIKIGQ
ncbi:hypothetical protein [Heyndrickxia ginsengihumi]|uniref:hypothetical protein n=1 Tax=Heyndrickxia ginsengihumi TaxID=363870 RepID=UPI003D213262